METFQIVVVAVVHVLPFLSAWGKGYFNACMDARQDYGAKSKHWGRTVALFNYGMEVKDSGPTRSLALSSGLTEENLWYLGGNHWYPPTGILGGDYWHVAKKFMTMMDIPMILSSIGIGITIALCFANGLLPVWVYVGYVVYLFVPVVRGLAFTFYYHAWLPIDGISLKQWFAGFVLGRRKYTSSAVVVSATVLTTQLSKVILNPSQISSIER